MRELRISLFSVDPHDTEKCAMLEIGLQILGMSIAAPYPGIVSSFAAVFLRLTCVRWIRGLCKP